MSLDKLSKNVTLFCPICGNDQFLSLDCDNDDLLYATDEVRLQCSDCKNVFTKQGLLEKNEKVINDNIEDFKEDIMKELEEKIKKVFK